MNSSNLKYYYGVGRRKSSTARAKYYPNQAQLTIQVNKQSLQNYFPDNYQQFLKDAVSKLEISTGEIHLFINGGGLTGQAGSARLAIAKALLKLDEEKYRPLARSHGYLTTDIRKVLSKKAGKHKARKSEQWSKR